MGQGCWVQHGGFYHFGGALVHGCMSGLLGRTHDPGTNLLLIPSLTPRPSLRESVQDLKRPLPAARGQRHTAQGTNLKPSAWPLQAPTRLCVAGPDCMACKVHEYRSVTDVGRMQPSSL